MSIIHDTITKTCAQCGREFGVSYPDQWAYKTGTAKKRFFCSWSCLRQSETEGKINMTKLTLDDKNYAVKIALDGGNPLEYIRMCGVKNAAESWMRIKDDLRLKDPETWEKLPKRLPRVNKEEAVPLPEVVPEEMVKPVVIDTPDGPKEITTESISKMTQEEVSQANAAMMKQLIERKKEMDAGKPMLYSGFVVTAVEGEYGRYFHDKTSIGDYIDYESKDGDELSMTIDQWRAFLKELHHAAAVLGVKL